MPIRAMLLILGAFHLANGVAMLAAPAAWYAAVPGVAASGPLNHHFLFDVALAFLASGAGLVLGAGRARAAAAWASAGATWPALHALFHLSGWLACGLPHDLSLLLSDGLGVIGAGALGVALAWARFRQQGGF